MPRQARLDAPGTLATRDGARARSQLLFRDDADRADFVARLAGLAASGVWLVFAWALLFNHLHLPRCNQAVARWIQAMPPQTSAAPAIWGKARSSP